jgi:hypothetical protein
VIHEYIHADVQEIFNELVYMPLVVKTEVTGLNGNTGARIAYSWQSQDQVHAKLAAGIVYLTSKLPDVQYAANTGNSALVYCVSRVHGQHVINISLQYIKVVRGWITHQLLASAIHNGHGT